MSKEEIDYGVDGYNEDHNDNDEPSESNEPSEEINDFTAIKEYYEYKPLIRTEIIFLTPENRKTSEIMTRFEVAEVLSHRAKQIEKGGRCFTDIGELTDPLEIAKKELVDKKCPFDVIRHITDNIYERWHVNEMSLPLDY